MYNTKQVNFTQLPIMLIPLSVYRRVRPLFVQICLAERHATVHDHQKYHLEEIRRALQRHLQRII